MTIRSLQYFLAVAQELSMSLAAQRLQLSQSTLTRSIQKLEDELGVQLFVRTSRNVRLTNEGIFLKRRAEEILELAQKTTMEFSQKEAGIGNIYIGSGETPLLRFVTDQLAFFRKCHPETRIHLYSNTADNVSKLLDHGLLDFGVLIEPADTSNYHSLTLPGLTAWGLLLPENHSLAQRPFICPSDLSELPFILPNRSENVEAFCSWLGKPLESLHIVATYNLLFNAGLLAETYQAPVLARDHLADMMDLHGLCFRPLEPPLTSRLLLVWNRNRPLTSASELFLRQLCSALSEKEWIPWS